MTILAGVLQGAILGPLSFNIFINYFFFYIMRSSTTKFVDDNTLNVYGDNLKEKLYTNWNKILKMLHIGFTLIKWLQTPISSS